MESFRECGWPAFVAAGAGTLAILMAVAALSLALVKPRTGLTLGILAMVMSCGPAGIGFAGMLYNRHQIDTILTSGVVSADKTEEIRAVGYHEAGQCVSVGGTIAVLPFVLAGLAIAIGLGTVRKPKVDPT